MNLSGMLHGASLLKIVDFPASEVLGPEAGDHEIHSLIERCGSVFVKADLQGRHRQEGQIGLIGRAKDSSPPWPKRNACISSNTRSATSSLQVARGDLRGRGSRQPRNLFLDHRLDPLPRAGHDAHAPRRHGHRRTRKGQDHRSAVRPADGPEVLRRRQRADGTGRAARNRLAAGAATAQAVGSLPQLRHDHAGTESRSA